MSGSVTSDSQIPFGHQCCGIDYDSIDSEDVSTKKRSRVPNNSPPSVMKPPSTRTPHSKARRICDDFDVQPVVDQFARVKVGPDISTLPGIESSVFLTPDDTPDADKVPDRDIPRPISPLGVAPLKEPYQPTPSQEQTTPWTIVKQARRSTDIPKFALPDEDLDKAVSKETKNDTAHRKDTSATTAEDLRGNKKQDIKFEGAKCKEDSNPIFINENHKKQEDYQTRKNEKDVMSGQTNDTKKYSSLNQTGDDKCTVFDEEVLDRRKHLGASPEVHSRSTKFRQTTKKLSLDEYLTGLNQNMDRTIGLKMGLRYVDIIGELMEYNLQYLIFQHLNAEDLYRVCSVSSTWQNACRSDPASWRRHKKQVELDNHFQSKVVKSLLNHEFLNKCPRCSSPARVVQAEERAHCTWQHCDYIFCTKCHCAAHNAKKCPVLKEKPPKKLQVKVGSSKSKKNLRRL
ncbi:F-box only protein 5-B-like isoform X2 [Ptychodera flava]|uniref:F-box only protein 5-B-like isoform X2 n=1 Tax=Ptychodera flava TaxID=63121 RepID=UPI00396A5E6D